MSLPELCIRRPVMTTLLMLSFIVFGIFGYMKLPVSALPDGWERTGRNAACPCGSGSKFKHCHGALV